MTGTLRGHASFPGISASEVLEVARGEAALRAIETAGFWAVVVTFEGEISAVRFGEVERSGDGPSTTGPPTDPSVAPWLPLTEDWETSLDEAAYVAGVEQIRERIASGEVYQVNLCRVLSHPLSQDADLDGLAYRLERGNPAPHSARIRCAAADLDIVCASPELFLARKDGRVTTRPIKGTAPTAEQMLPKDIAENIMIVDLMRNDLSTVCEPGTVRVDGLCEVEEHPGLVHLVSTVSGHERGGALWSPLLERAYPPGSVSGAPKSSALRAIEDLEPVARGPYCGAIGWVDADRGTASLAVGIRTFWAEHDTAGQRWLRFGTGAGITWHSDPKGEWDETELKAARLVGIASGRLSPETGPS